MKADGLTLFATARPGAIDGNVWAPGREQRHGSNPVRACPKVCSHLYPRGLLDARTNTASYRHGWGTTPNPTLGLSYLSQAASNSAAVESQALQSGMKKGGAAKGELVLAMYELAQSFRHGWGVEKDPVAARSYYETAANLGDTDAMNEVARCYEEGVGGKKDKVRLLLSSHQGRSDVGLRALRVKGLHLKLSRGSSLLHLSPPQIIMFQITLGSDTDPPAT